MQVPWAGTETGLMRATSINWALLNAMDLRDKHAYFCPLQPAII